MHFFTLSIALLLSLTAIAQAPTNGLVAYYPFNGNALDISGKNNNGIIYGTVNTVPGQSGAANGALSFTDGSKIRVSNSNSLTFSTAFSYSTWIQLRSLAGRDGNTGLDGITNYGVHTIFSKNCDKSWLYSMLLADPKVPGTLNFSGGTWDGGWLSSFFEYPVGTWMHLAVACDERVLENYINGRLMASSLTKINFTPSNTTDLIIGGMDCWPYFINGELDEMRFYNRALTREEIQAMYVFEKAPVQSLKIGSWQDPTTWSCTCVPTS